MTTLSLPTLVGTLCITLAQAANAQQEVPTSAPKMLLADCTQGQGCACAISNVNIGEASVLLGVPVPPGNYDDYVILRDGNNLSFETKTIDVLHRDFGGQGACAINPLPNAPAADPADDGGLVPLDGVWQIRSTGAEFNQCHPMIEEAVRGSGALTQNGASRRINWGGRFDPSQIEFDNVDGQAVVWTQTGPASFEGAMGDQQNCSGAGCSGLSVMMSVELTSPTTIAAQSVFDMGALMPDSAGMVALPGMSDCRVKMDFAVERVSE